MKTFVAFLSAFVLLGLVVGCGGPEQVQGSTPMGSDVGGEAKLHAKPGASQGQQEPSTAATD